MFFYLQKKAILNNYSKILDVFEEKLPEDEAINRYGKGNYLISENLIDFPILEIDNSGNEILREATRIERIQLNLGGEKLKSGEYIENGKIVCIPEPDNMIKKKWNEEKRIWEEGASEEEKKIFYKKQIDKYKAEILDRGFIYEGHNQRCRDKDLALLSNAISALEDAGKEEGLFWAFSDNDILKMTLNQLKEMRVKGMEFINTVYEVEAFLKRDEVNLNLTIEAFKKMINKKSKIKTV
ncbi:hypothetical protein AAA294_04930 [Fusobacterium varium]|uniref:DUF4376 domain-containing protein n=1 Tax=Fusobacterium varium TaxID=856 RepID=UPI0032C175F2